MVALSSFLAVLMLVQGMPLSVFAEGPEEETIVLDQDDSDDGIEDDLLPIDPADAEIDTLEEPQDAGEPDLPASIDTPQVLFESNEKRTSTSKTFHRTDGLDLMAVYPEPVHFVNSEGAFVDYDNRLVETKTENGIYLSPKANDMEILLSSATANEALVRLSKDGYHLSWTYDGITEQTGKVADREEDDDPTTLENLCSELDFVDIYPNVDLQYLLIGGKLKENLVLKDAEAPASFVIHYSSSDLTPELDEGAKTILWKDAEGETVFEIEAPFAVDAKGETSTELVFTLSENGEEGTTAVLELNEAWLKADDRAFPVTVDPMIVSKQFWDSASLRSAFVSESYPNNCYGRNSVTNTYVGSLYVGDAVSFGKSRGYIYMPLPTLQKGDVVVNATLYTFLRSPSANIQISLHEASGSWQENTITWNNAPAFSSAVTDFNNVVVTDAFTFFNWDITKLVDKWYKNPSTNFGVVLRSDAENWNNDTYAWFYSTGYFNNDYLYDPVVRPMASLELRNVSGYENYYTYVGAAAGRGEADVNVFNGNLTVSMPITMDNGGLLMPVNISAVYNGNQGMPDIGRVGNGWQMSYQIYLRDNPYLNDDSREIERRYRYFLDDADGTRHYFYFENDNATVGHDEDGLGLTLNEYPAAGGGTWFSIDDEKGNSMIFDTNKNLTSIHDANGNAMTIAYDQVYVYGAMQNRPVSITDGAGRVYTIVYNTTYPMFINKIVDPSGRETVFTHGENKLHRIKYPDDSFVYFTYDGANNLLSVSDVRTSENEDVIMTTFTYDDTVMKRVSTLQRSKGTTISEKYDFTYQQYETIVEDYTGKRYDYQLNAFGQNTGIVSESSGSAAFYAYNEGNDPSSRAANRVISASNIQTSVNNYIPNADFDGSLTAFGVYKGNSSSSATAVYDANVGHFAPGSAKITKSASDSGSILLWRQVTPGAGTYTFSAYVRLENGALPAASPVVIAEIWTTSGTHVTNYLAQNIQTTANGEWVRQSVTFTLEAGQCVRCMCGFYGTYGTVWVDDLQLEKSYGATPFNLIEDGCFVYGVNAWNNSAPALATSPDAPAGLGSSEKLTGSISATATVSQTVSFNGAAGDLFSAGAWAKATSVPTENDKSLNHLKSQFLLKIELLQGSTVVDTKEAKYNPYVSSWQFVSTSVKAARSTRCASPSSMPITTGTPMFPAFTACQSPTDRPIPMTRTAT